MGEDETGLLLPLRPVSHTRSLVLSLCSPLRLAPVCCPPRPAPQEQFRRKLPPGKTVSIHPVSARWKKDIRSAFEDVKKTLYDGNRDDLLKQAKSIRAQKTKVGGAEKKGGGGCF